jgi:hypothetical protein
MVFNLYLQLLFQLSGLCRKYIYFLYLPTDQLLESKTSILDSYKLWDIITKFFPKILLAYMQTVYRLEHKI